jgi:hypothetical protein
MTRPERVIPERWLAPLVAGLCLVGLSRISWLHFHAEGGTEQPIDARFAPIRSVLPARGELGFVSDAGTEPSADVRVARAYLRASFALAPLVLVTPDRPVEWIVGDFQDPSHLDLAARRLDAEVYHRAPDGLAVLRRTGRKHR